MGPSRRIAVTRDSTDEEAIASKLDLEFLLYAWQTGLGHSIQHERQRGAHSTIDASTHRSDTRARGAQRSGVARTGPAAACPPR
jgi:hypothetical protein